jgi:hypothetical protein
MMSPCKLADREKSRRAREIAERRPVGVNEERIPLFEVVIYSAIEIQPRIHIRRMYGGKCGLLDGLLVSLRFILTTCKPTGA